jgi:LysR family transcriptional regulator (chromosome initiation inhibitor)
MDTKAVEAVAAVLETGGFEKAAEKLNITQSAVSQRVKLLEARLGQPLVIRTTPTRATAAGQAVLAYYRQVAMLEHDLLRTLGGQLSGAELGGHLWGEIAIGVNADSLDTWFFDAFLNIIHDMQMAIELVVDDQDHTLKLLEDGMVLGCVSTSDKAVPGCRIVPLGYERYDLLATPSFQHTYFAEGVTAAAIARAPAVLFNKKDDLHAQHLKALLAANATAITALDRFPCHYVPSVQRFLALILAHGAYGLAPRRQAAPYLKSGDVVALQPDQPCMVPLYWHVWRINAQLADQLTKLIVRTARACLIQHL